MLFLWLQRNDTRVPFRNETIAEAVSSKFVQQNQKFMKKTVTFLLIVLSLSSCKSTKKVMDSWLGHSKQSLIASWGPPARTASDGGNGEILIYSKQVYIPQYQTNYYDYKMFYANSEGKIYRWLTKRENIPPTQIDLNVYRRY